MREGGRERARERGGLREEEGKEGRIMQSTHIGHNHAAEDS